NEDSAASSDSASEYMQSEDSFEKSSSDGSSLGEDAFKKVTNQRQIGINMKKRFAE
ncbi:6814_t:CDS:2, partial [Cetraspora pellucida]